MALQVNEDQDQPSSRNTKPQLQMLSITEQEVKRLQAQQAIAQTVRIFYARALEEAVKPPLPSGDTLKL